MSESAAPVEIPQRALFKPAEVCEMLDVRPYVLRSWESEFPDLGLVKSAGGSRVYRRADVEQVARIKHLLLVEGLTLAGARRRLEKERGPVAAEVPVIDELIGQHARERLTDIKRSLRSILDLLGGDAGGMNGRQGGTLDRHRSAVGGERPDGPRPALRRPKPAVESRSGRSARARRPRRT